MAPRSSDRESVKDLGSELARLILAYAKQETLDPLKALGRYVLWGVAGAVFLSIGLVLLALAVLRLLQAEATPALGGNLTWVPYLGGIALAVIVAGAAAARIVRSPR